MNKQFQSQLETSRGTPAGQPDNYSLQEQSTIYEMIRNSYPTEPNSVVPFMFSTSKQWSGETAAVRTLLYGSFLFSKVNFDEQMVFHISVINDLGEIVTFSQQIQQGNDLNGLGLFTFYGVVSAVSITDQSGVPIDDTGSWQFVGWKVDMNKNNAPGALPDGNYFVVTVDDAHDPVMDDSNPLVAVFSFTKVNCTALGFLGQMVIGMYVAIIRPGGSPNWNDYYNLHLLLNDVEVDSSNIIVDQLEATDIAYRLNIKWNGICAEQNFNVGRHNSFRVNFSIV